MKRILLALLLAGALPLLCGAGNVLNVRDFGAKGDGASIDTPAINAAIEAAAAQGGGVVEFPAGTYMSYSIHLKSNITLRLLDGSIIRAAKVTETEGFDEPEPNESNYQDFGHSHWQNSLIWGIGLENVTIEGSGLIDGTGSLSRTGQSGRRQAGPPTRSDGLGGGAPGRPQGPRPEGAPQGPRPDGAAQQGPGSGRPQGGPQGPMPEQVEMAPEANKALALKECRGVTVTGVKFLNCGHFALLLTGVDDLLIDGVTADTNRDAFDIDCCERVVIRNCKVNSINDDGIVLKSSYALGYEKPTQDVLIEDCAVSGYDAGTFLDGTFGTESTKAPDGDGPTGRIKFGTESNGGFRRVTIRNCTFTHCRGLALESVDGAELCDIDVNGLVMDDICTSPIYIRLGDRMRAPEGFHPSSVHDISIKNVTVRNADSRYACQIVGLEGNCVRNVRIENLDIEYRGGITLDDVKEQRGANPFFFGRNSGYPEPSAHGIQPAWGFSLSHADGVVLKNIRLTLLQPDERELFFKDDVKGLKVKKLTTVNKF